MSMPSYWFDPMVNTLGVPGNDGGVAARLNQSATNSVAANNALANETFQQGQDNFWNWSDNATRLNAAHTAANLAIGNAQPVGTYNGNALSPFAVGASPIQHLRRDHRSPEIQSRQLPRGEPRRVQDRGGPVAALQPVRSERGPPRRVGHHLLLQHVELPGE